MNKNGFLKINENSIRLAILIIMLIFGIAFIVVAMLDKYTMPLTYVLSFLFFTGMVLLSFKYQKISIYLIILVGTLLPIFLVCGQEQFVRIDGNEDIILTRIYMAKNYVFSFPAEAYTHKSLLSTIAIYSGFPGLSFIGIALTYFTGLPLTTVCLLFSILLLIGSTLLIERITFIIFNNHNISVFSAMVFILWPEQSYWYSQFTKQTLGFFLVILMLYLLIKIYKNRHKNNSWTFLYIIGAICLAFTHYTSAAIMVLFLVVVLIYNIIQNRAFKKKVEEVIVRPYSVLILIIIILTVFIFYSHAFIVSISGPISSQIKDLTGQRLGLPLNPTMVYLPINPPLFAQIIPIAIDLLLAGLTLGGFIYIYRQYKNDQILSFVSILLITSIVFFLAGLSGYGVEMTRFLLFISIPAAIFSGYYLYILWTKHQNIFKIVVIVFLLITPFALWTHKVAPLNVYRVQTTQDYYGAYPMLTDADGNTIIWMFDHTVPENNTYYSGIEMISEKNGKILIENVGECMGTICAWSNDTLYQNILFTLETNQKMKNNPNLNLYFLVEPKEANISSTYKVTISNTAANQIYDNGKLEIINFRSY